MYQHTCSRSARGEEKEKETEKIMTENFPNLLKNINLHIQEAERTPNRINTMRSTPRYIIVKLLKDQEKILKTAREK